MKGDMSYPVTSQIFEQLFYLYYKFLLIVVCFQQLAEMFSMVSIQANGGWHQTPHYILNT